MARTQTVWDADGNQVTVRTVDAAEIIANGGSATAPVVDDESEQVTYTEADAIEQNDGEDVTAVTEEAPKKRGVKRNTGN